MRSIFSWAACLSVAALISNATSLHAQDNPQGVWIYAYDEDHSSGLFNDVTLAEINDSQGYAAFGWIDGNLDRFGLSTNAFYLVTTDRHGQRFINKCYTDESIVKHDARGRSVVTCDDGGYLMGGCLFTIDTAAHNVGRSRFTVFKVDRDGELEWRRYLGNQEQPWGGDCWAVIELKNGNYCGVGRCQLGASSFAYAVMLSSNGETIWENTYSQYTSYLTSVRETEDGLTMTGFNSSTHNGDLIKINLDGDVQWDREWQRTSLKSQTSSPRGGFAVSGSCHDIEGNVDAFIMKVDDEGREVWRASHDVDGDIDVAPSVAALSDGGFITAGRVQNRMGLICRFNSGGELIWTREEENINEVPIDEYWSVVVDDENSPIFAGASRSRPLIVKLEPIAGESPMVEEFAPATAELFLLAGDAKAFSVTATDPQEDELSYSWMLNGEVVGETAETEITFPDIADYAVKCVVSDGENETDVEWTVHAVELYIESWSPEPFQFGLRKNVEVEFGLTVRALESDDDLQYRWLVDGVETGVEAGLTHTFATNGVHTVEGAVYRGDEWRASDAIVWNVTVTSLINNATPDMDSLTVYRDDAVMFHALPLDTTLEITYSWRLNDRRAAGNVDSLEVTFDAEGLQTLTVSASHEVETDRHSWTINVLPPNDAGAISHQPSAFSLSAPRPNPFNSKTVASFQLPVSSVVKLGVYDLSGRLVKELVTGTESYAPGRHSVTWDAAGVPAGNYIIRLEAAGNVATTNVTLIK